MERRDANFNVDYCKSVAGDDHSAIRRISRTRKITLFPRYFANVKFGIQAVLKSEMNRYSVRLGGVFIAYEKVCLLSHHALSAFDQPYMQFNIKGKFYVFQPTVGCTLKGVVNKVGHHHISCLVHNFFNATIQRAPGESSWLGEQLQIGQEILFQVTSLDFRGRITFIRGYILEICTRLSLPDEVDETVDGAPVLTNGLADHSDNESISKFSVDLFASPKKFKSMEPSTSVKQKEVASSDASDSSSDDEKLKRTKDDDKSIEMKASAHKKKKSKKRRRSTDDEESGIALGDATAKKRKKKDSDKHKKKKKKHSSKHKKEKKASK